MLTLLSKTNCITWFPALCSLVGAIVGALIVVCYQKCLEIKRKKEERKKYTAWINLIKKGTNCYYLSEIKNLEPYYLLHKDGVIKYEPNGKYFEIRTP